jgi:hypothetical protein
MWENDARREGLAEGEAKLREAARKLKALGDPVDKIAGVTGLTPDEIKKL